MCPANESDRPVVILLVEDNPGDVRLVMEALRTSDVATSLCVADDGEIALEMLFRRNGHVDAPRPDLVLLDLNLPRVNGREVLTAIKTDPDLRSIPVIVLTTSTSEADIVECYDRKANCYLNKPVDFDDFIRTFKHIEECWLKTVQLPRGDAGSVGDADGETPN